jgi:hypothetical protein
MCPRSGRPRPAGGFTGTISFLGTSPGTNLIANTFENTLTGTVTLQ